MTRGFLLLPVACSFIVFIGAAQPTYTGISGFWDYQTNYRTPQYIRRCPNSSVIHAIMMVADDSLNPNLSRRTAYAFSSNNGITWTTFNQIRVPARRSGYPSLDIGQGTIGCAPIIANHNIITGTSLESTVFVDFPAGGGAFAEIAPPSSMGSDEPGFPEVAGAADGSIVLVASRFAAGSLHVTRTDDFLSWQPWGTLTLDFVSDGFVAETNTTSRVGVVVNTPEGPLSWYESTNNGNTWPATPAQLLPGMIPAGSDTFVTQQGLDLVYLNGDTLVTFGVTKLIGGNPTERDQGIGFYSRSTGFVLAAPHSSILGVTDTLRKHQTNQHTVGYPAIGLLGPFIVIAFQAFMPETSAAGFNYSDVFTTFSLDGRNWSHPLNATHTLSLDERYPSMSKWNTGGAAVVFQEDPQPGSAVFGDNSPLARVRQKFILVLPPDAVNEYPRELPDEFTLFQNYPNPFNPTTAISYQLTANSFVSLRVFDVLGREIATLVNEQKPPGTYSVLFDARSLTSGVYFYRLVAGGFVQTRKLLLMR